MNNKHIELYYNKYKNELVCANKKYMMFYLYNHNNKLWEFKKSNDVYMHFVQTINKLTNKDSCDSEDFNNYFGSKMLLPDIALKFYDKDFVFKLNNNNVLSINGNIIDLSNYLFRTRTINDLCSQEIYLDYKKNTKNVDYIFNKMFDDPKQLQSLLGYAITNNIKNKPIVFEGNLDNREIVVNLLRNTLGPYYDDVTKSKNNGSQLSGTRIVFSDKSDDNQIYQVISYNKNINNSTVIHFPYTEKIDIDYTNDILEEFISWIIKGLK